MDYSLKDIFYGMIWSVVFHPEFAAEFADFGRSTQNAIAALALLLEEFGPQLGRPYADTLVGSRHSNMKELRCDADGGLWRVAFAFDPERKAVLLIACDKRGVKQQRFYKKLIARADERFDAYLATLDGKRQ